MTIFTVIAKDINNNQISKIISVAKQYNKLIAGIIFKPAILSDGSSLSNQEIIISSFCSSQHLQR